MSPECSTSHSSQLKGAPVKACYREKNGHPSFELYSDVKCWVRENYSDMRSKKNCS